MPKLTAEQEQFLKDLDAEGTENLQRAAADTLRWRIRKGTLKYADLKPEQLELMDQYPEEKPEA